MAVCGAQVLCEELIVSQKVISNVSMGRGFMCNVLTYIDE